MDVDMPLVGLADLAVSDRALESNALEPDAEIGPPPGIDLEVLTFAREMFVDVPGWPVLPARFSIRLNPSNLQLKIAGQVVDFLYGNEKVRFEIEPGRWLQKTEARGYLLAAQCGQGLLKSAQAAHDIGKKAAKQVALAETRAKQASKAATKRLPEAQRGAAGAAARAEVWDKRFSLFACIPAFTPCTMAHTPEELCRHRSWASGPHRRLEAKESAAKEVLRDFVDQPRPEPPLQTTAAPSPLTGVETPRHIRHFPDEDEAVPPQPPIAGIDLDAVVPDIEATRARVRILMHANMELHNEMRELRHEHETRLLELKLEHLMEMRESNAAVAAAAAAPARDVAEIESESEAKQSEMDRELLSYLSYLM